MFEVADIAHDGNGSLDMQEFKHFVKLISNGKELPRAQNDLLFQRADSNGDGRIDIDEILDFMVSDKADHLIQETMPVNFAKVLPSSGLNFC